MIPKAFVQHRIGCRRVRFRIPARRGDRAYFTGLLKRLDGFSRFQRREANPLTGSVVIEDGALDMTALAEYAQQNDLFYLDDRRQQADPLTVQVAGLLEGANRRIRTLTGGDLDLPETLFILFLVVGLVEIVRGNFRSPPWYTAFWYAFGVFSKSMLDRATSDSS